MIFREHIILFIVIVAVSSVLLLSSSYAAAVFFAFSFLFLCLKAAMGKSLHFSIITIPSLFMFSYFVLMSLPSLYWFFRSDSSARFTYLLAVQSVLVMFPIGMALAMAARRRGFSSARTFLFGSFEPAKTDGMFFPLFLFFLLFSLPVLALYFFYAPHVQLVETFRNSEAIDATVFRFAENALPEFLQLAFEFLRRFALPFSTFYVFFIAKSGKPSWKISFWLLFIFSLIVSSLTLDRAEPVALFGMLIVAHLLAMRSSFFELAKNRKLLGVLVLAMAAGGLISIFQYQGVFSFQKTLQTTWYVFSSRIFLSPSFMALRAFHEFPDITPFLYGSSIKLVGFVTSLRTTAYYPATFVGDLWRNFGFLGVLVGSAALGFFFQYVQDAFFLKRNAVSLSLYVVFLLNAIWLIFGNAFGTVSIATFVFGLMLLYVVRLTIHRAPVQVV